MDEPYYASAPYGPSAAPDAPDTITVQGPNGPVIVARNGISASYADQLQNLATAGRDSITDTLNSATDPLRMLNEARSPGHGWHPIDDAGAALGAVLPSRATLNQQYPSLVSAPTQPPAPPPVAPVVTPVAPAPMPVAPAAQPVMAQPQAPLGINGLQDIKAMKAAGEKQAEAVKTEEQIGAKRAAEQAGYDQEELKQRDAFAAQQAQIQAQRDAAMKAEQDKLAKMQADVNATKIDPDHFWAEKGPVTGTLSRILSGIAIGLGAYGSARTGGPNQALGIINKAIDDDIASQQANLANKQKGVEAQRGVVAQTSAVFGDKLQAANAARVIYLDNAVAKAKALDSKFGSDEAHAKAQGLLGGLAQSQAQAVGAFNQRNAELATHRDEANTKRLAVFGTLGGKGGKNVPARQAERLGQLDAALKAVNDLEASFKANTGWASAGTKHLPGTPSGRYEDQRTAVAESLRPVLGASTEKLLPASDKWDANAKAQFNVLRAIIKERKASGTNILGESGYNTSNIPQSDEVTPNGKLLDSGE